MNVFALVSGGKDSIYNIIKCIQNGHKLIAIGHLFPFNNTEIDSYMYQTVGSEAISNIAQCLNVPLITKQITNSPINIDLTYTETPNDEVEHLYDLIKEAQTQFPQIQAVSSGAILSKYQKNRVENVCKRLNLVSLAYLWERKQDELLNEMIANNMNSVLVKTCAIGLGKNDLMKSLKEMKNKFDDLYKKYQLNVCGEGGEYETITLDCDIYVKKIVVDEYDVVCHSSDPFSPVYYAVVKKMHLEDK